MNLDIIELLQSIVTIRIYLVCVYDDIRELPVNCLYESTTAGRRLKNFRQSGLNIQMLYHTVCDGFRRLEILIDVLLILHITVTDGLINGSRIRIEAESGNLAALPVTAS